MKKLAEVLQGVKTVAIAGHVRPDGDCTGSCMGLYLYLNTYYPEIRTDVYLEPVRPVFSYIERIGEIKSEPPAKDTVYDLIFTVDVSVKNRIGVIGGEIYEQAKKRVCIDHHISNPGFADENHILGDASSSAEVLYKLLEPERVTRPIAEAIYTGIIHDTGVFQYSSTSPETLRIAGELMQTGLDYTGIIQHSFYEKSYNENQIMGRVLTESILMLGGKSIVGWLKKKDMDFYGVEPKDLDGIVGQLRLTKGVEVAVFLYELAPNRCKVSLRSNGAADVNRVASEFGGGGHVKAAGCELNGTIYDVVNALMRYIEQELDERGLL